MQGSNPFGRQVGIGDQQPLDSLGSVTLSDPGSLRRLSVGSGLPSGFLPRPSGLHPVSHSISQPHHPSHQVLFSFLVFIAKVRTQHHT